MLSWPPGSSPPVSKSWQVGFEGESGTSLPSDFADDDKYVGAVDVTLDDKDVEAESAFEEVGRGDG